MVRCIALGCIGWPTTPQGNHNVVGCNQVQSDAIGCNQVQSCAIRCNQVQSGAIRCNQVQSGAIRCNQVQSGAIRCNQVQSGAIRCNQVQSGASNHIPRTCSTTIVNIGVSCRHTMTFVTEVRCRASSSNRYAPECSIAAGSHRLTSSLEPTRMPN